jgi:hypothetical protein
MDRLTSAVAIVALGSALAILTAIGIYNGFGRREAYERARLRDGT